MIAMNANFTTLFNLCNFLAQAILFWTLDRPRDCVSPSLAPLLVYTTLAYPLVNSASSGHAVLHISRVTQDYQEQQKSLEGGKLLIAVWGSPEEWVLCRPGCPLYTPWAFPPGESGRLNPPLLSLMSPGLSLFRPVNPLPHFLEPDLPYDWTDKLLAPTKIFRQASAELALSIQRSRGYKRQQKCWSFHSCTHQNYKWFLVSN